MRHAITITLRVLDVATGIFLMLMILAAAWELTR